MPWRYGMNIRAQAGAGLMEIAVAVLVLSVGTLGLVRGQLAARQAASEALQRSEAVVRGTGLLEQLRGNPEAFLEYSFNDAWEVAPPDHDCGLRACSPRQWGAWSLWHWLQGLRGSAVVDEKEKVVAGLIAPQACLSVGPEAIALELSWRLAPSTDRRVCMGASPAVGVRVLSLEARREVPEP